MRTDTRRMLDKAFTGSGVLSVVLLTGALLVILAPLVVRGVRAIVFTGTVEHRRVMLDRFGRGDRAAVLAEWAAANAVREPVYTMMDKFQAELDAMPSAQRRKLNSEFKEVKRLVGTLLGDRAGGATSILMRNQYGAMRMDRARVKLDALLFVETWDYSDKASFGRKVQSPREELFRGTALEPLFGYFRVHFERMMLPRRTVYWGFFTDESFDSHLFGGIWPELLGTFYLAMGAMLCAVPAGVLAAIFFSEYAGDSWAVGFLRTCVSTLAGVPSIVFGLFGLAFFIGTVHVSPSKSVLAGALTLALMILPTLIRTAEEAIRAVPQTYREAALSLGGSRWHTILTVVLPAALPGILTGVVISLGRAAGETAPIIFTAAVSVGKPLQVWQTLTQPTPAMSWNIFNLATEHEAVEEVRHVQYGMVLALVGMVLLLNLAAILLRARVTRKLRG
jgi:phosphate transport system permease protein